MAYSTLYQHYYKEQQTLMNYLNRRGLSINELQSLTWADIEGSNVGKGRKKARLQPDIAKIWRRCKMQAGKQPMPTSLVFYKKAPDEFSPGVPWTYKEIWERLGRPESPTSGIFASLLKTLRG